MKIFENLCILEVLKSSRQLAVFLQTKENRVMINEKNVAEWSKRTTVIDWANDTLAIAKVAYRMPGR